jgi:hypothetical protein
MPLMEAVTHQSVCSPTRPRLRPRAVHSLQVQRARTHGCRAASSSERAARQDCMQKSDVGYWVQPLHVGFLHSNGSPLHAEYCNNWLCCDAYESR